MKKRFAYLTVLGLWMACTLFVVVAHGRAAEEGKDHDLAFESLPVSVRNAVLAEYGTDGKFEAETEVVDGVPWYEVQTHSEGREISLRFTEDGELVEREVEIAASSLPDKARRALDKQFPGAQIEEVEAVELHFYNVEFVVDGTQREFRVYASGQIEEISGSDAHEDDEDDDDHS